MKEYKYIEFHLLDFNRDTRKFIYICCNKDNEELGTVEWYEPWNQYVYKDLIKAIYSTTCLLDIADFVNEINNLKNK